MKNAMKRWIQQPRDDIKTYLQKCSLEFQSYSSNMFLLNHVFHYIKIGCIKNTTLDAKKVITKN